MNVLLVTLFVFFSTLFLQENRIPIIIDADTANEIDDLFAIIRAVESDRMNVLGITSAQFHISPLASDSSVLESQEVNVELMKLLNREEIPLPMGSNHPLLSEKEPRVSEASSFIVSKAHEHSSDKPLNIVILGSCTNVASAIIQDPSILSKIKVYYLGFWHNPESNTYNKKEFNSGNDTIAVNFLLDEVNLNLTVMSATTSQKLVFKKDQMEKQESEIGKYLFKRWVNFKRWWTSEDPENNRWIMWDVALIEALIHPEWSEKKKFTTPPENTQRTIEIYTWIDAQSMTEDFWTTLEAIN